MLAAESAADPSLAVIAALIAGASALAVGLLNFVTQRRSLERQLTEQRRQAELQRQEQRHLLERQLSEQRAQAEQERAEQREALVRERAEEQERAKVQLEQAAAQRKEQRETFELQLAESRRQLALTQEAQLNQQFTVAIEHLGADVLELRIGGLVVLGRLLERFEGMRGPIIDIVTSYLKSVSPYPRPGVTREEHRHSAPVDVQTALDVLMRRPASSDAEPLNLAEVDLEGAVLRVGNLGGADLSRCNLDRADLTGCNLDEASLVESTLSHASLDDAKLRHALLRRGGVPVSG